MKACFIKFNEQHYFPKVC